MSPYVRFGSALLRIATATSVIRTRNQDITRREVNGGRNGDLDQRTLVAVRRLEAVADKLEKTLA
jgi:hypothetical protein